MCSTRAGEAVCGGKGPGYRLGGEGGYSGHLCSRVLGPRVGFMRLRGIESEGNHQAHGWEADSCVPVRTPITPDK
jgi:hypothetical protein